MYRILETEILKSPKGTLLNSLHGIRMCHLGTESWGLFWPLTWPKDWFEVTLNRSYPAMWQDPTGKYWMADRHMARCDLGSVPPFMRARYPVTEFPHEYYQHDCSYNDGFLWTSMSLAGPWVKEAVTRSQADEFLSDMIYTRQIARGKGVLDDLHRGAIWVCVRGFGWVPWKSEVKKK